MAFLSISAKKNFKTVLKLLMHILCNIQCVCINISHKKYFSIYQYNLYLCNIIYKLINMYI